ncbi:hypothetical protein [Novosphingobium sp.]|uniref:hypothetical protein n=1 Tax=Novosphingobium sp. TaxID=1874826 RepID=UPI00286DE3CF|nr:hypothetical protein [Novosphingobium sp.]
MIANAGAMGLNWERLSLSGYLEALEAANEMNDPNAPKSPTPAASSQLKRFIAAHQANDS